MVFTVEELLPPVLCFALAFHLSHAYDLRSGSVPDPDATIARVFAFTALVIFPLYVAVPWLRPSDKQLVTLFVLLLATSHLYLPLRPRGRSRFLGPRTSPSRTVLVFGTSAVARAAARELERSGYTAIRFTESNGDGNPGELRTILRAAKVIAETKPVRIVVCLRSPLEELPMCELFEQQIRGVPIETGHEAYERLTGKIFLDERTPLHLLLSHAGLSNRVYGTTKRFVSAVVAAMALVVALPVMVLIALSIYATEGGPVLFVQERVGLHGRPFRLLKFRSMRAEKGTSSEWERDNEERITPLGRWLRKLHLDELPQLWNIFRGDMDLVGPRPHPVSNHELFARSIPYYSLRSVVRPGLTGWAQVRQGYAHDLPGEIEKMRYDLCAIARPSLLLDLWVLLTTAKILLVGHPLFEREALSAAEKAAGGDSVPLPFDAPTARALLPASIRKLRGGIEPRLVENWTPREKVDRGYAPGVPGAHCLQELGVSDSPPRGAVEASELSWLSKTSAQGGSFGPANDSGTTVNEVVGEVVTLRSAAGQLRWDRIEGLAEHKRRVPGFAGHTTCFLPPHLGQETKHRVDVLSRGVDGWTVLGESCHLGPVRRQGFARLLAAVAFLSIAGATLQLIALTWSNKHPNPTVPATAMSTRSLEPVSPAVAVTAMVTGPQEPTSPATFATTQASDLASLDAAAMTAKAIVQRSELSNAKVLKSVLVKRMGDQTFIDGINHPRYEAEVGVEIARGVGGPIKRKYFITLQYLDSREWQIEHADFETRY